MGPEFSETQFTFSFLREYLNQFSFYPSRFWLNNYIELPSTKAEIETAADFIFRRYSHSVFFQFKRSHCFNLKGRRGLNDPERNLHKGFFPYYRFQIYNAHNSRQFEKLRDVSTINSNDKAYYCAPLFHTNSEFKDYYGRQAILSNSILINCSQFLRKEFNKPNFDIRKDEPHHIAFNRTQGYIFSEPIAIKIQIGTSEEEIMPPDSKEVRFPDYVQRLFQSCLAEGGAESEVLNTNNPTESIFQFLVVKYNIIWVPIFKKH